MADEQAPWEQNYENNQTPIVLPGTDKGLYTDAKGRVSGFAGRMVLARTTMDRIETSGFDPVNIKDVGVDNWLPFVPEWMERFMLSDKYKLYEAAKMNWKTAQLRRETGAVINDSEIVWIEETYFPQLGDGDAVAELKREARDETTNAMITEAGSAYKGLSIEEAQLKSVEIEKQRARNILLDRAKKNPELAKRLTKMLGTIK